MADQPLIGPQPAYPTPWRLAEHRGDNRIIACAAGHWVAEVPDNDLAELIVSLVNRETDPGMVPFFEANEALRELAGQLAEARDAIARLTGNKEAKP